MCRDYGVTVITAVPLIPSTVAVTLATPAFFPKKTPPGRDSTTAVSPLAQTYVLLKIGDASASTADAIKLTVAPTLTDAAWGIMRTIATSWTGSAADPPKQAARPGTATNSAPRVYARIFVLEPRRMECWVEEDNCAATGRDAQACKLPWTLVPAPATQPL